MSAGAGLCVPDEARQGELAAQLRADVVGEIKAEYCGMFDAAQDEARRRLHDPLTAEDHDMTAALAEGTRLCSEVISQVWNALHP